MGLAWIGLGSNLGDSAAHIKTAIAQMDDLPKTACLRVSKLYRSAPVGPQDQADYCNAVAQLQTELSAPDLLTNLLGIEQRHQRVRSRRWGPRSLDLDLLLYDDLVLDMHDLQLPHPRLHERAFVLQPLTELAPGVHIPGQGPAVELLPGVSEQVISLWDSA